MSDPDSIVKFLAECSKCENEFELWNNKKKCRPCHREYQRKYYAENKERLNAVKQERIREVKKAREGTVIICSECGDAQDASEFRGTRSKCHECEKAYGRKYRRENPDKARAWSEANKERHAELQARWFQEHKDEINTKERMRYRNDPEHKLHKTCRRRLLLVVKKDRPTDEYLGAPSKMVKQWLEFCFEDSMTWANHGTHWHIDHVIPISRFDMDNEVELELCWNWKNLSPMIKGQNSIKGNRLDLEQVSGHVERLRKFATVNNMEVEEFIALWDAHVKSLIH